MVFAEDELGEVACDFEGLAAVAPVAGAGVEACEVLVDVACAGGVDGGVGFGGEAVLVDVLAEEGFVFFLGVEALLADVLEDVHAAVFEPVGVAGLPVGEVDVGLEGVVEAAALSMQGV